MQCTGYFPAFDGNCVGWLSKKNLYLDDILIVGRTLEEYLENIARVLDQLQEIGLKEIQYLGHTIFD